MRISGSRQLRVAVLVTGYSGNGYTCTDVNECEVNNGGCSTNPFVECINTPGSRTCQPCPDGNIAHLLLSDLNRYYNYDKS